MFGTDEAGLELRPDHRWSKLARDANGRYTRMQGWDNNGNWESLDNGPGNYQLTLIFDSGGNVSTIPVFAKDVPKMRLNNNGVYIADYALMVDGSVTG